MQVATQPLLSRAAQSALPVTTLPSVLYSPRNYSLYTAVDATPFTTADITGSYTPSAALHPMLPSCAITITPRLPHHHHASLPYLCFADRWSPHVRRM